MQAKIVAAIRFGIFGKSLYCEHCTSAGFVSRIQRAVVPLDYDVDACRS